MIINFRYHVVTLVAVFMALTVGIFIGSFLQGDDVVMEQQDLMIKKIEEQLTVLSEQNQQVQHDSELLKQQNAYYKQFEQNVFPFLAAGILPEHKVAIIITGEQKLPSSLTSNLNLAGAKVDLVLNIKNNLDLTDCSESVSEALGWNQDSAENNELPLTPDQIRSRLIPEIAQTVLNGDSNDLWNKLSNLNLIQAEGEASGGIREIILLGDNSEAMDMGTQIIDLPLIKYYNEASIRVCGSEISTVPVSHINEYQALGISTVDNLDYLSGQYAAILVLAGANGHYGIKTTAQSLIPDRSFLNSY